ncbi:YHS domain-containing (seleno)protein [Marinibacterium sp. SX1]|uniref:YHS domain-containing (seleno)protein n=1 Tax=Marinibacterium sp. SX1 TaxID=3388424 RepID=UPI003D16AA1A
MMTKTTHLLFATLALLTLAAPGFAEDEYNLSTGGTLDGVPLALRGVDPVALSTLGAVTDGTATHTVIHDEVAYYFASETSAETFRADPEAYVPQYGGFCAFAVALGKKLDGDPRYADIVDGKLYLFVNAAVLEMYRENPAETLTKAEEVWPGIRSAAADSL